MLTKRHGEITLILKVLLIGLVGALLPSCAIPEIFTPEPLIQEKTVVLPEWVQDPWVDDGFATTECVVVADEGGPANSPMMATALARSALSKRINQATKRIERVYARANPALASTTGFTPSPELLQHYLSHAIAKAEYVDFPDKQLNYCVMAVISAESAKSLFDKIIAEAGVSLENTELYRESFLPRDGVNGHSRHLLEKIKKQ